MALTSGTKLGFYEIDVALKALPAEMAHDPKRLARFRREAKALAQLDHPNNVTIPYRRSRGAVDLRIGALR